MPNAPNQSCGNGHYKKENFQQFWRPVFYKQGIERVMVLYSQA